MLPINQNKAFLKIASISAFISAITTFFLWLLPKFYNTPANFTEAVSMHQNAYYISRLWVNFIHIPFALTAYFGLTLILYKKQPATSLFGMMWLGIWGTIEMIGVAALIFTVNGNWRSSYALANDQTKTILETNITSFMGVWDSLFFVILVAFLLGSLFFAIATQRGKGLEKLLSYLLWAAVPLTVLIILSNYANQAWAGKITGLVYPALQPVSRAVLGLFILKHSRDQYILQKESSA